MIDEKDLSFFDEFGYLKSFCRSDLQQTKASLNEIASENEQLKIAIGKARYGGPPPTPEQERERIEKLQLENEELKNEVSAIFGYFCSFVNLSIFLFPPRLILFLFL